MKVQSTTNKNLFSFSIVLLILVVFGYQCLSSLRSVKYLMNHIFVFDYAFYYFQIARNIAANGRSTFDGNHATTTPQLLWGGILTGLAMLVTDKILFLRAVSIFSAALNAVTGLMFFRIGKEMGNRYTGAIASLLWCGFVIRHHPTNMGTEFPLHTLLITITILFLWTNFRERSLPSTRHIIALALLLTVNFWIRMDSAIYSVLILLSAFAIHRSGAQRAFLKSALIVAAGAALFVFVCYQIAGIYAPASSLAKIIQLSPVFSSIKTGASLWHYIKAAPFIEGKLIFTMFVPYQFAGLKFGLVQVFLILVALATFLFFVMDQWHQPLAKFLLLIQLITIIHLAAVLLLVGDYAKFTLHYFGWMYAIWCLSAAIAIPHCLFKIFPARIGKVIALFAIALFLYPHAWFIWTQAGSKDPDFASTKRMRAGLWIRDHLPADARIGAWNAGTIGYFSDRPVVDLSGISNDRNYLEWLRRNAPVGDYLKEQAIHYLCDTNAPEPFTPRTRLWNPSTSFHGIISLDQVAVLYSEPDYPLMVVQLQ